MTISSIIKLKAGETVVVAAVGADVPTHPIAPPGGPPVDPGYGIDAGLGFLRPTHPIALPPTGAPPKPTHPIELPPPEVPPVDPGYGIDEDIGYVKPEHPIVLPGTPEANWELKVAWTPVTGWVVVAIPTGEHPTPSRRRT